MIKTMMMFIAMILFSLPTVGCSKGKEKVRIGHFPNITHAQPLVGRALGTYEKHIGTVIDWKVFNAGPTEMEALIAGQLDIALPHASGMCRVVCPFGRKPDGHALDAVDEVGDAVHITSYAVNE